MKIIFAVYVCFFLPSTYCSAQQLGQPISVPVLQEDKKIDVLMDMVLKTQPMSANVDKNSSPDSCWFIEMFKWNDGDNFSFQLYKNSKSAINFRVNWLEYHKRNYGYFVYKGNEIFIVTKDNFYGFFTKTSNSKTFKFIFYSNDRNVSDEELEPTLHYKFTDGYFSVEGPPPIIKKVNK